MNYLRVEKVIVMPTFGSKQDDRAVGRMERLFRDATIVPLRCEDLARKGGVLNCCTWSLRTSGKISPGS
jgi:agmatine deiminase